MAFRVRIPAFIAGRLPMRLAWRFEHFHHQHKTSGLLVQTFGCNSHFFDQCHVLLCRLIHLGNGFSNLCHPKTLLVACRTNFPHQIRNALDGAYDLRHGASCGIRKERAFLHPLNACTDEGLDFFGCLGTASSQNTYFGGHHGKPPALFSRASGRTRHSMPRCSFGTR